MSSPLKTSLLLFLLITLFAWELDAGFAGDVVCSPDQRTSLLELKKRFVVPSTELVSWRPGSNCCNWEGVTCDRESGLITELDINNRSIRGTISPSLFNITSLRKLNLAFNPFRKSSIPTGFELLGNLESLNLSCSRFSGQIPDGIASLRNLVTLDLSGPSSFFIGHGVKHENPNFETLIQNLSSLRVLYLDGVNLSAIGNRWNAALVRSTPKLRILSLPSCSLSGPISSSLTQLRDLSVIELSYNDLNSTVPKSFRNFSSLSVLSLESCGLRGTFPNDVLLLKNLTEVYLLDNPMLSGSLPDFGEDNKLRILDLSETNFSGLLPFSIGVLKSLMFLDLDKCQFSGVIPWSLFRLPGHQVLVLALNNFTGIVEADWFRDIKYLDLSYNRILLHDTNDRYASFLSTIGLWLAFCNLTRVPNFLKHAPNISFLDLSNNKIAGPMPNWIQSYNNLNHLNFSHNLFTLLEGPLPSFKRFHNIKASIASIDLSSNLIQGSIPLPPINCDIINYSNNRFASSIPPNISAYINNTSYFSLANNNLTGEIPPSICKASSLQILDLSGNKLSGRIPPCLLEVPRLEVVNLGGNQLQGTIPHDISKGCELNALILNSNNLEGRIPPSLAGCNKLEVLDLGNNHLEDSMPFWLGDINSLRDLVLRSNALYGLVEPHARTHESIDSFGALQILDISSNSFNGSLPKEFFMNFKGMMLKSVQNRPGLEIKEQGRQYYQYATAVTSKGLIMELTNTLKLFTSIDFSDNTFSGDIPEAVGELLSLNTLNFSNNALTSIIPPSVGKLTNLESLDLSGNHISGRIPQALLELTFLSYLNLSGNNLVGEIPQGHQFSTFTNSSYTGNEGLCGSPLSKKCHDTKPTDTSTESLPSKSDLSRLTYVIGLALSIGLGYGMGIAIVLVLQNTSWAPRMRRFSSKYLDITIIWLHGAIFNILKKLKKTPQSVRQ